MGRRNQMSEALPLKYRPDTFDDVVGNEGAVNSMKSILKKERNKIPKAWLFTGEPGCGKTSLARILSYELGCSRMDFQEYNASSTRGIGFVRIFQENVVTYPRDGEIKIYLFDEVHRLTAEAQDAILKTLEEPPDHVFILLATTDPGALIGTIHSRCTKIKVEPLSSKKMIPFLKDILYEELGKEDSGSFPDDVLKAVSDNSNGACRDALKLLDMIIDMDDFDEMIEVVQQGVPEEGDFRELVGMLMDSKTQWVKMGGFLKTFSGDPEKTRRGILKWFTTILLSDGSIRTALILEAFENNYYETGKTGLILSCFQVISMK